MLGGYTQPSGTSRGRQGLRNAPAVSLPCLLQVFSREELGLIAELCVKHDVLCISDEVYEWLVYDGKQHIRMGTGRDRAAQGREWGLISLANPRKSHWKSQELPACTAVLGMIKIPTGGILLHFSLSLQTKS